MKVLKGTASVGPDQVVRVDVPAGELAGNAPAVLIILDPAHGEDEAFRTTLCDSLAARTEPAMPPTPHRVWVPSQIARLCGVRAQTVKRWLEADRMHGYRIPGSQEWRVPDEQVVRYLRETGWTADDIAAALQRYSQE